MRERILSIIATILVALPATVFAAKPVEVTLDSITYTCYLEEASVHSVHDRMGHANIKSTFEYNGRTYTVTSIEPGAFKNAKFLKSIIIPNTMTTLGRHAFTDCHSKSVTIPNSVTEICNAAFYHSFITEPLVLPDKLTAISDSAFCQFYGSSVIIPNSVKSIGKYAFAESSIVSATIANSVTVLGESAFSNCKDLSSITLSSSLDSIKSDCFYYCKELKSITIPKSVRYIGESAFLGCYNMETIDIYSPEITLSSWAFKLWVYPKPWTEATLNLIDATIKVEHNYTGNAYPWGVFDDALFKEVNITDLSHWCRNAFTSTKDCPLEQYRNEKEKMPLYLNGKEIVDLVIPSDIKELGFRAFSNCRSIESVRFPEGFESLNGGEAFLNCNKLKKVYFPSTIKTISELTFSGCDAIEHVYCAAPTPPQFTFERYHSTFHPEQTEPKSPLSYAEYTYLHVPKGSKQAYLNSPGWKDFGKIIEDIEPSGIEDVQADATDDGIDYNAPYEVYDMSGVKVADSAIGNLAGGIYIVRQGIKTAKISVK